MQPPDVIGDLHQASRDGSRSPAGLNNGVMRGQPFKLVIRRFKG
jgi:hypothetical protein